MTDTIWWAWVGLLTWSVRPQRIDRVRLRRVLRGMRWWFLPLVPVMGIVAIALGAFICAAWPSVLGWSWLSVFGTRGTNVNFAPADVPWLAPFFLAFLFIKMPAIASTEERWFRQHTRTWAQAVVRSLCFGLAHCLVGVPIGFGLALGLLGFVLTLAYWTGGMRRAVALHTAYNWFVVALVSLLVAGR